MLTESQLSSLPPRKVYRSIARKVFEQESRLGTRLPRELRFFSHAAALHGETLNGGLSQYFTNSCGKDYRSALEALRRIGATRQAEIVSKWISKLPPDVRPGDRNAVGKYIFAQPTLMKELEQVDQEYFKLENSFYQAVVDYVSQNKAPFGIH